MRRRITGLVLLFACLLMFQPVALAEDVKVSVTADPSELSEAGTVDFTFEISNNSIYELHNVTIAYMGESVDIMEKFGLSPMPIGGSFSGITLPFSVSDAQLGQPLTFTVSWLQGGEPFSQDVQCTIARAANPVISVTRTVSAEMAKQGETITVTYELKNETKFDMTDIILIDEQISDNTILSLDILKANGSFTLTHPYKMGTEDAVSAPVITYMVNGKAKVYSSIAPITLSMLLVQLDMSVDAGMPTQAGVTFTLEIKNTGNQEVRDIQITDERANPVNSSLFSLAAGESVTYPYLVVPVMTEALRNVSFKLNGTDPFGNAYTLSPGTSYEVYPFVDDSQISVTLRAETVTPWTSETGTVTARIILTNYSTVTLTNVVISESTIGTIKTLDTLPAGETTFDQELLVGSPRNLQFSAKGNDPTGTSRELADYLLPVAYSESTLEPSLTAAPSQIGANPFSFLSTTISKILIVLGVLMVLAFVALIVLSMMERSKDMRTRFDDDEDQDDDIDELFNEAPDVDYKHAYEESEEEYFTKRFSRPAPYDVQQSAERRTISLPAPASPPVLVEYDGHQASPDAVLNEIEAHTAEIMRENDDIRFIPEPEAPVVSEEPDLCPDQLSTPKIIAARQRAAIQPVKRGQIHHVHPEDEGKGKL